MEQSRLVLRTLSALGIAAIVAACSGSGSSGKITPSSVSPDSQTRLAHSARVSGVAGLAYVVDQGDNNVSAYLIKGAGVLSSSGPPFKTGTTPTSVTIDASGKFAYVTNSADNNVSAYAIDASTGALKPVKGSPFPTGTMPLSNNHTPLIAHTATDSMLCVTNYGDGNMSVYGIDAKSGSLTPVQGSPFPVGSGPIGVAVDPTGNFVYVANSVSNDVSAYTINAKSFTLTPVKGSPFKAGAQPAGAFVSYMAGAQTPALYVTNEGSNDVSAYTINASTGALTPVKGSPFRTGNAPVGVAAGSDYLYATNSGDNDISAYTINAKSGALTPVKGSPFKAGTAPHFDGVHFNRDNPNVPSDIFVTNYASNDVSAYTVNAKTGALTQVKGSPFPAGTQPSGVATCTIDRPGTCIPDEDALVRRD